MPAAVANSYRNTGGAAATATCTFSATAGNQLESWIRGSANASATVANVFDNSGGDFTNTGTPTTTTMSVAGTPWTVDQWAGRMVTITAAADAGLFRTSRLISSNTNNTLTFAAFGTAPVAGGTFSIGNAWAIADSAHGNAWTLDGGAATSHAQWWEVTNCLAASSATQTVVWGGGSTGFTVDIHEISGAGGVAATATAAAGSSATPVCNSVTGGGLLLGGFSVPTTAMTWSSALDNSAGTSMTVDTPPSGTYRIAVTSLHEASGAHAPRITASSSEGWVATPLLIPDVGGAPTTSLPPFRRPYRFFRRRT